MEREEKRIYLDHAAATPVRDEVVAQVRDALFGFANPSSIHMDGVRERGKIEKARRLVAGVLGSLPEEIVFTSGSTEGLNVAIQGVIKKASEVFPKPKAITSAIEHPSILETLRALEKAGQIEVEYLTPDEFGVISPEDLKRALTKETALVALSFVNSEIGTVSPIEESVKVIRDFRRHETGEKYPCFLLDATQAARVFALNVQKLGADIAVLDGAKIGGIKGSGILYLRDSVAVSPVFFGGGQESGLRPGTQNVVAIESISLALELSQKEASAEKERLESLRDFFLEKLKEEIPSAKINSNRETLAPHIVSACFQGSDAEYLVLALDARGISVSRGSACKSGKGNESEVLRMIEPSCAASSIRFSFGKETAKDDLERTIQALKEVLDIQRGR